MIIGLTGRIASGKGVVSEYLQGKGFDYFTISTAVREEAKKRGIEITRKNLQDLGNLVRKEEGAGAWAKRVIKLIDINRNYVIDGIRHPAEVDEFRKIKDFYLISIDAPQETRYKRLLARGRPSDPKTFEGFLKIDERDFCEEDPLGQHVGKCMELADFKIMNDSDLESFYRKVDEIYREIVKISEKKAC